MLHPTLGSVKIQVTSMIAIIHDGNQSAYAVYVIDWMIVVCRLV